MRSRSKGGFQGSVAADSSPRRWPPGRILAVDGVDPSVFAHDPDGFGPLSPGNIFDLQRQSATIE